MCNPKPQNCLLKIKAINQNSLFCKTAWENGKNTFDILHKCAGTPLEHSEIQGRSCQASSDEKNIKNVDN